ncbi:hypothetical protein P3T35_006849 [Kitasatospora sp. GP30]|uniref:hypothetical protein n=1 Tax=Kitasatospora sp. GP30 TaxID=3035084 RepID=UPI000C70F83A|nr:hypothetical protein [Kitasatospora sp. GP30]MDH6144800.1 hypothetical protein [Kitasatospora sp. GP30]
MSNYQPPYATAPRQSRFGPVNWRVVRISIPITLLSVGLVVALTWSTITKQFNPPPTMHTLVSPNTVTIRSQPLKLLLPTAADRPRSDAESEQSGREKQFVGLARVKLSYSPDGTLGTNPDYQVSAAYGQVDNPAHRMQLAIDDLKAAKIQQITPMHSYSAGPAGSGDIPVKCGGMRLDNGQIIQFGWCTWANRSTVGTVQLASYKSGGPSDDDLAGLAQDTLALRDQLYAKP